jgi:carbon monoxide dehydrogenase subunit G
MLKIESKIGTAHKPEKKIYDFLSDFNNFNEVIPTDKVNNWEATENTCSFNVTGVGSVQMEIVEKEPTKMIKIEGEGLKNSSFTFWIQLKEVAENDTKIKLSLKAEVPAMIKMMAQKPLKQGMDMIVDRLDELFDAV